MPRVYLAVIVASVLANGCQQANESQPPTVAIPETFNIEKNPTAVFEVPSIQCEGCCQGACEALARVPGVVDVHASHVDKRVIVAVDKAIFDHAAAKAALETHFDEVVDQGEGN